MKYLGYDFYAFKQNTKNVKKKGKLMVANTLPQVKANEIVGKCRDLLRAIRQKPVLETFNTCKNRFLGGRYSSWGKDGYYCFGGLPIIRIEWANWDSSLISANKGVVRRKKPMIMVRKSTSQGLQWK